MKTFYFVSLYVFSWALSESGLVLGHSIKIYSRAMNMKTDELMKFLRSHRDFTVIGVLGGQWSGKSTILNRLCKISSDERGSVFPIATTNNIIRCSHRTTGLDVYVTQEPFIFIDIQVDAIYFSTLMIGPIGTCSNHFRHRWFVRIDFSLPYFWRFCVKMLKFEHL